MWALKENVIFIRTIRIFLYKKNRAFFKLEKGNIFQVEKFIELEYKFGIISLF